MLFPPEVNLSPYHIINRKQEIPKCYGPSFLVKKDGQLYVAQYFYKSWVKDDYDNGISPYHSEIMAMDKLKNGAKSICKYFGYNNRGFKRKEGSIILFEFLNSKSLYQIISQNPRE